MFLFSGLLRDEYVYRISAVAVDVAYCSWSTFWIY